MLNFAARHGKRCLFIGLVIGLSFPALAQQVKVYLPALVAGLLFLASFRMSPAALLNGLRNTRPTLRLVAIYQVAAPLVAVGLVTLMGVQGTTAAFALILMLSAPSVTGSPNFAILMGQEPDGAWRLLVVGTALFPVTVFPVLWLLPEIEDTTVVTSALRLAAMVLLASGTAFALRKGVFSNLEDRHVQALDGAGAILLAVVVIGLMSAVGPLLLDDPLRFLAWLGFACCVNFGLQLLAWSTIGRTVSHAERAGVSIVAGNRNIALFLVALPPATTDALLEFIGCYQIPMYLTPVFMAAIYNRAHRHP
ncbi:hypothetical protein ACFORG_13615 [Lutimaribacter marinistellae]|uniref:Bile acid:Na+ symporter, BASS family n=1 Tax=Lutimaribacter marinistellae TaxID=1820329 RepID=A0ABV7THL8_9RHOB